MSERLTITVGDGHQLVSRHTLDASHMRELLGVPTPDWTAERGHQGGVHTLETCEVCAARNYVRARNESAWADADAKQRDLDRVDAAKHMAQTLETSPVSDTEHTALVRRQFARLIKLARHCPERRIPEIHKNLRLMQAQMMSAPTSQQHALGIVCSVAADIAWSRWMDARQGGFQVKRHGESTSGRILWSDLDHVDKQAMVRNSAGHWDAD